MEGLPSYYPSFMKPIANGKTLNEQPRNVFASLLKEVKRKISCYFEPEEVEVTFEGNVKDHGTYTYTVVQHKQVA